MTELDEHKIVTLHLTQHIVPKSFGDEGAATSSRTGEIQHVHFGRVEIADERITPTESTVRIVIGSRVSDDEYRSQLRVDWLLSL